MASGDAAVERDDDAERGAVQVPRRTRVAHGRAGSASRADALRDGSGTRSGTAAGIRPASAAALTSISVRIPCPSNSHPFLRLVPPSLTPRATRIIQGPSGANTGAREQTGRLSAAVRPCVRTLAPENRLHHRERRRKKYLCRIETFRCRTSRVSHRSSCAQAAQPEEMYAPNVIRTPLPSPSPHRNAEADKRAHRDR